MTRLTVIVETNGDLCGPCRYATGLVSHWCALHRKFLELSTKDRDLRRCQDCLEAEGQEKVPRRPRPLYGHGVVTWTPRQLIDGNWRWDGLDAEGQNLVMVDDTETMERFLLPKPAPSVHPDHWDRRYDFASLIEWT